MYVCNLRRALPGLPLHARKPGYLLDMPEELDAPEEQVDVHRFRRLIADAQRADPPETGKLLHEAFPGVGNGPAVGAVSCCRSVGGHDDLAVEYAGVDGA
ncbi:hypothetical protein [Plantactinospora endophytica]|uniref:Uncharacterized protein n=1 Tax=Plantactinospora endophytica TaxID=673535 RepID=A0ABQ4EEW0_9ACTN|nr:hypothetical protein [Plantactinospora endophytica]GIG93258.1 hypothetical protein Pen02_81940 [Plantactinospora endophytica]